MGFRRVAVVMAGGSGTRFWPVSTPTHPKQFLRLASGDATLLEQSVRRIAPLVGDDVCVATTADLVAQTRSLLPGVLVFGEPARRNTLGALVWATAQLLARYPGEDVSVAVLTADHAISPDAAFLGTVSRALDIAEERGSLTTIGIKPTRPATEYGYIETGEEIGGSAWAAKRFTEKPKADTATEFLRSGRFLWNSGMFFWTVGSFVEELRRAVPEAASALDGIARALGEGDEPAAIARFADVPSISIDYALMERAENVAVAVALPARTRVPVTRRAGRCPMRGCLATRNAFSTCSFNAPTSLVLSPAGLATISTAPYSSARTARSA